MRRIGLVLGAGGIVGQAYHAGVLRALSEAGWDPASSEIVVGTSAGSLVGGDDWPDRNTWICAVRRKGGERVVFGSAGAPEAPFSKAIAASCAIPGYFQPVRIVDHSGREHEYVDGGAHSPTNLDLLAGR